MFYIVSLSILHYRYQNQPRDRLYQPKPAHTQVTQINTKSIVPIVSVTLPSALTVEKLEKKTVISKKTCIMDWLVFILLQLLWGYFVLFLLQLCKMMVISVWMDSQAECETQTHYIDNSSSSMREEEEERGERREKGYLLPLLHPYFFSIIIIANNY